VFQFGLDLTNILHRNQTDSGTGTYQTEVDAWVYFDLRNVEADSSGTPVTQELRMLGMNAGSKTIQSHANNWQWKMAGEFLDVFGIANVDLLTVFDNIGDNNTATDFSKKGETITYTDASDFTTTDEVDQGLGYALSFDDTNDVVTISDSANLEVTTGDFTIFGWFQIQDENATETILGKQGAVNITYNSASQINIVLLGNSNSVITQIDTAYPDGWYFFVMTVDGSTCDTNYSSKASGGAEILFYINGVVIADGSITESVTTLACVDGIDNTANNWLLGASTVPDYFNADMKAFGILVGTEASDEQIWDAYVRTYPYAME